MARLVLFLAAFALFCHQVLAQGDAIDVLNALGFTGFAGLLQRNPLILNKVRRRDDITMWVPGNAIVSKSFTGLRPRQTTTPTGDANVAAMIDHLPPEPAPTLGTTTSSTSDKKKRQSSGNATFPDSNFQIIYTFLEDPEFVNLGGSNQSEWTKEPARFVKNQASPLDGAITSQSIVEVKTGLGRVVRAVKGPFKFDRGVIYEVEDFFTLPQPFSTTFQQITTAQRFYNTIVSSGLLTTFENTPRVTIFAPVDSSLPQNTTVDPKAHIVTNFLGYSPDLNPSQNYTTLSGQPITVTFGVNGERLVNGRRLLQANVILKNGVVHFIDGTLDGISISSNTPPAPIATGGASSVSSGIVGILVAAIGAILMASA